MALGWRNQYTRYKDFFLNVYDSYTKKSEAKMFVEILLSVTVSAFFVFLALRPTVVTILELVRTIQEKERTISQMQQKIKDINTARDIYEQNSSQIALISSAIPTLPEPEVLSRQVQGLAQENSVDLTSLAVEEVSLTGDAFKNLDKELSNLPEGSQPLTFSLNVKGSSFPFISALLSELERLRVPVKLDSFSISSSQNDEAVNLILVVGGRTPYLSNNQ